MATPKVLQPSDFYIGGMQWIGDDHLNNILNGVCQDYAQVFWSDSGTFCVAIGADGAGQGKGSQLAATFQVTNLADHMLTANKFGVVGKSLFNSSFKKLVEDLRILSNMYAFKKVRDEILHATLFGFAIDFTRQTALAFEVGDGINAFNGKVDVGSTAGVKSSTPVTLAYALLKSGSGISSQLEAARSAALKPRVNIFPLHQIETIAFGSDGWTDDNTKIRFEKIISDPLPPEEEMNLITELKDELSSRQLTPRDDLSLVLARRK